MNINISKYVLFTAVFFLTSLLSCKKDFLNKKPNTNIVIPSTLADMTQLLDDTNVYNTSLDIVSADEYLYTSTASVKQIEKNAYVWLPDIYRGEKPISDWTLPYNRIFTANVVLEEWEKLSEIDKNSVQGKYVKGWASFTRAFQYYSLVQLFSKAYDKSTAESDLGMPLKLSPNVNNIEQRASVQKTYDFIISELESSINLFSNAFPTQNRNRPSKAAALALLARTYLCMAEYEKALNAANASLSYYDQLLDYNGISKTASKPFDRFNVEILFYDQANQGFPSIFTGASARTIVNSELISTYDDNDLRKVIFFSKSGQNSIIKDGYSTSALPFKGIAVDEVYLIKAECQIRNNDKEGAVSTINKLLEKRFATGLYTPFYSDSPSVILDKILTERRKELIWRGLRWCDLKRLNVSGANITISRTLDGKTYTLAPNDRKYVLPIPDDEIAYSRIQQNIR